MQNGVAQRVEKYGGNVAETSIRSKVRTSPWEVRKTHFSARSARPAVSAPNNVLVCVCVCEYMHHAMFYLYIVRCLYSFAQRTYTFVHALQRAMRPAVRTLRNQINGRTDECACVRCT